MREREELDMHVMTFPPGCPSGYEWRVIKSEERLAEERLAEEVRALKVNRSEKRVHVEGRLIDVGVLRGYAPEILPLKARRLLKQQQTSLFPPEPYPNDAVEGTVRPDGRRVKG